MKKKEFKTESKKLMELMINSIYTNKEIFLREIISNASDAIDKLYYNSLVDDNIKVNHKDLEINIAIDKDARTLTISDNGIGMTFDELENNLGTIAKSGSFDFKKNNEHKKDIDIIGQFGVGFYSAFMVSKKVEVISKAYGSEESYKWSSSGVDGYSIVKCDKDTYGTDVILYLKDDVDEEEYSEYLDSYKIRYLIKKYSDYITYPIKMEVERQELKKKKKDTDKDEYETVKKIEVINSLVPIWKRNKSKIKDEEYDTFYSDKFNDYEKPLTHIHVSAEGLVTYNSILYIPSHAPYDYYTKEYEKGLQLYSNGVLIMEKCSDLLPDYFSFVKGIVDSEDISLNISRETMQSDKQIKVIARSLETKIKKELVDMLKNERDNYIKFYEAFGEQLKYGIYSSYGMNKEVLQDLLLFYSSRKEKLITLDEYLEDMSDDTIYYASGETIDKIKMLPNVINALNSNKNVLFLTNYLDEFVIKVLGTYKDKKFMNVLSSEFDLSTEEEKENLKKVNEDNKSMLDKMTSILNNQVKNVRFTNKLKDHAVCLTSEGDVSLEMEKVLNAMPNGESVKANKILEINENSKIADKLKELYASNSEELEKYTKILYNQARLIEGLSVENPTELTSLICEIMAK